MSIRQNAVIVLESPPQIVSGASAVGQYESEGPLSSYFDVLYPNDGIESASWEKAESALVKDALKTAIAKARLEISDIDVLFAGDLLNQCTASTFGVKDFNIPFAGLFGACSTFALALLSAALTVEGGAAGFAGAGASSHFCSAEKQFRMPLEYGGQRTPTAQRTVTGSGYCILAKRPGGVHITKGMFGRITDFGVSDVSNMGAAMAPAAADTVAEFFRSTHTRPKDYDRIVTGDLGSVGSKLFLDLLRENAHFDCESVHEDCGNLIYDAKSQDVHAGGSGAGCSAAVISSYYMKKLKSGEYKKILFAGTGALMSPLTSLQKQSIPAVCHAVLLEA